MHVLILCYLLANKPQGEEMNRCVLAWNKLVKMTNLLFPEGRDHCRVVVQGLRKLFAKRCSDI